MRCCPKKERLLPQERLGIRFTEDTNPNGCPGGIRLVDPQHLPVSPICRNIDELKGISTDAGLRIGALTPVADLAAHPVIRADYPVLAQAASVLGSVQIRNAATVGGNLSNASPCADTAGPLLVLGARVEISSGDGVKTVALDDFFTGPKETVLEPEDVLTTVIVDPPEPGTL